ncbi:MAG: RDD family protein [Deltaproteobacteria bacterium]|nr:RDD family protein [Deltaproteobacteria bacterium]
MPLPKPIPRRLFQVVALVLLVVTFAITAWWGVTFTGPWADMAHATTEPDGTYDLVVTAFVSWLVTFVGWLLVVVPLRVLTPFPTLKQQLATLDGPVLGALGVAARGQEPEPDPTLASPARRVAALLIDRAILLPIVLVGIFPVTIFDRDDWSAPRIVALVVALVVLAAVVAYAWARDAIGGRSLGRRLLGIRVVDARTRRPIGAWRSFKREVPLHVSPLPFIELALLFASKDRRRLGDRWADTIVVRQQRASASTADDPVVVGAITDPRTPPAPPHSSRA